MAALKWGGRYLPQAYIVAESREEEEAIKSLKPNYAQIGEVEGRIAMVISATHPMSVIENLKQKIESFNSHATVGV